MQGFRTILASIGSMLVLVGVLTQEEVSKFVEASIAVAIALNAIAVVYKVLANKREEYLKNRLGE